MSLRQIPPTPFVPANNQWTQGLVFFTILENTYALRNFILPGGGTSTKPQSQDFIRSFTGYPGLNFEKADGEFIDWDRAAIGPLTGTGISVIARIRPTTGSGDVGSIFGTWQSSPQNGFMLYFQDNGGADEGIAFIVSEGGANLFSATGSRASYSGYESVAGGRYDNINRRTSVWQNGRKLDEDTDAGTAWLTTATNFLRSGSVAGSIEGYDGDIYWIACFNRALTDQEMFVWQTHDPLELLLPPEPLIQVVIPTYHCSNEVLVDDETSMNNPFRLATTLLADAILGGDLASTPPVPAVYSCENEVTVLVSSIAVATGLISTRNTVLVADSSDAVAQFSCSTEVFVGSTCSTTVGNQLVADRYRR